MIATLQRMSAAPDYAATAGSISIALRNFKDWIDARRTRKALAELSDEQLADIGLTRADIDTVALRVTKR